MSEEAKINTFDKSEYADDVRMWREVGNEIKSSEEGRSGAKTGVACARFTKQQSSENLSGPKARTRRKSIPMSTKSSLAYGEGFHLYSEMGDEDNVHLSLSEVYFDASPGSVTVVIPRAIWEVIRVRGATNLDAAFWADEELSLYVKGIMADDQREYDDHMAKCEPCRSGGECRAGFFYRKSWRPKENELIAHWTEERIRQRAIADQIAAYKEAMRPREEPREEPREQEAKTNPTQ